MMNVRPVGLFVNTPFAPEPGTRFQLRVHIEATACVFDSAVEVVSNDLGPGFSTAALGMGLSFSEPESTLKQHIEKLCGWLAPVAGRSLVEG